MISEEDAVTPDDPDEAPSDAQDDDSVNDTEERYGEDESPA